MNVATSPGDAPVAALSIVELPWCGRRYASIAMDDAHPAAVQGAVGARMVEVAASAARDYALDGVRLRASPGAIRPLLRAGWQFWHFGCVRATGPGPGPVPPDGYVLQVGAGDRMEAMLEPLAVSLRAGIPACERAWRDAFDFGAAAERWLSDFLARGDLLVVLSWRETLAGYGLLSLSGGSAVLEDISILPGHADRGLSAVLLMQLEAVAHKAGFDVLHATVMHPVPALRRRLIRRLLVQRWHFHQAHFALPLVRAER